MIVHGMFFIDAIKQTYKVSNPFLKEKNWPGVLDPFPSKLAERHAPESHWYCFFFCGRLF